LRGAGRGKGGTAKKGEKESKRDKERQRKEGIRWTIEWGGKGKK
jgi:hypothetical protein